MPLLINSCIARPPLYRKVIAQSEEHGVFRISGELPRVGDYLLAVPGHICPTTIRYPGIHVMDTAGAVVDYYLHTARDRL